MINSTQTQLIATYGCNKYQLGDKMRNNFHIPDEYLGAMKTYRVVHMKGEIFKSKVFDGMITDGIDGEDITMYDVIYHLCTPWRAKRAVEVRVSFRKAREEFNLPAIALIEVVQELPQ